MVTVVELKKRLRQAPGRVKVSGKKAELAARLKRVLSGTATKSNYQRGSIPDPTIRRMVGPLVASVNKQSLKPKHKPISRVAKSRGTASARRYGVYDYGIVGRSAMGKAESIVRKKNPKFVSSAGPGVKGAWWK